MHFSAGGGSAARPSSAADPAGIRLDLVRAGRHSCTPLSLRAFLPPSLSPAPLLASAAPDHRCRGASPGGAHRPACRRRRRRRHGRPRRRRRRRPRPWPRRPSRRVRAAPPTRTPSTSPRSSWCALWLAPPPTIAPAAHHHASLESAGGAQHPWIIITHPVDCTAAHHGGCTGAAGLGITRAVRQVHNATGRHYTVPMRQVTEATRVVRPCLWAPGARRGRELRTAAPSGRWSGGCCTFTARRSARPASSGSR